jgi:hypothetical protein
MWRYAVTVAAVAVLLPLPAAWADPAAPQAGSPCDSVLADALTRSEDAVLRCSAGTWAPVATPYPSGDRWASLGPAVKVHGNGLRNPEIDAGDWTGTPLQPDGRCTVQQVAVVPGVGAGPPQDLEGQLGQPLSFTTPPLVFSVEFGGACLWQHR